jgi:hypothetical protein
MDGYLPHQFGGSKQECQQIFKGRLKNDHHDQEGLYIIFIYIVLSIRPKSRMSNKQPLDLWRYSPLL